MSLWVRRCHLDAADISTRSVSEGVAPLPSLALRASVIALRASVALALLAIAGCAGTPLSKGTSPLRPAQMSSDSVVLEMFFVRFPFGDKDVNDKLWEQIDEQQSSPDLRQRLARNGFRIGLLSGQMPGELSKLMELTDKPAPAAQTEGQRIENLQSDPRVVRRHLQLRAGQRSEIIASGIYPQLPVLVCESGRISGQTYDQAQGIFAVKSHPQLDGRVRLELVPELHHDQPRQRWVGNQGMLRLENSRPKKVYDDMALTADLAPGAMLILSSLPSRPGSLGHHFFTENEPRQEQKLLIVRLAQTQHDGLFSPPEPLKLEQ
jgi:hypothetical protein